MVMDALATVPCPMPLGYGGWSQLVADIACVSPDHVKNMASDGRAALKKMTLPTLPPNDSRLHR
jgi:hypothetical protein